MCPRATEQHGLGGATMARPSAFTGTGGVHSFGEEEYIDLDLSSCGEFEFRVCRSIEAAPCADELPRRYRPHKVVSRPGAKLVQADAATGGGSGGRRSTATVAPLQPARAHGECSRRRKPGRTVKAKLLASRAFFRSLFARTSCSDERCHRIGVQVPFGQIKSSGGGGSRAPFGQIKNSHSSAAVAPTTLRSSIEQEKLMDEEEHAASGRQRMSFSGVIKWRPATAPPFSARRSSCSSGGCPELKRSSSARSESEGLIQGAIAYCKRSQQQLHLARKSVSDAALCSFLSS